MPEQDDKSGEQLAIIQAAVARLTARFNGLAAARGVPAKPGDIFVCVGCGQGAVAQARAGQESELYVGNECPDCGGKTSSAWNLWVAKQAAAASVAPIVLTGSPKGQN
jgi:DNA-directed RNA polymerase subunit RPC12/RpoP